MGEGLWAVWAPWLLFGGDKLTSGSQSRERAHLAVVMSSGKKAVCPIRVSCGRAQDSSVLWWHPLP